MSSMYQRVKWGVLGVSSFAVRKVLPAIRSCEWTEAHAIASRDAGRAAACAAEFGMARSYGSYHELLKDPLVQVVYNPLPNHMHVDWSIRAVEAGKHVLCEKPVSLSTADLRRLVDASRAAGVMVAEAFMIRYHPQWGLVEQLIREGAIGAVRAVSTCFSYFNEAAGNIRNIADYGGGGMWDIGCYAVYAARLAFGAEPVRVAGATEIDPRFQTDRLSSGILEFPCGGQSVFVCSTQMAPYQRVQILGTKGRIEVEIPFNAPPGEAMRVLVDSGSDLKGGSIQSRFVEVCNQYTIECDGFSRAVLGLEPLRNEIGETFGNTAALEALFRAAAAGKWEEPEKL